MILTKQQILDANDLPRELVTCPEWGGDVYIRTLSGAERDAWEASIIGSKRKVDGKNIRAKLAALTMVGEDNVRLFTDAEVDALGKKSAKALDRVFTIAQGLNGVGKDDIDELEKNSGGVPSANLLSD